VLKRGFAFSFLFLSRALASADTLVSLMESTGVDYQDGERLNIIRQMVGALPTIRPTKRVWPTELPL